MITLDASVVIAFLSRDEPHHASSRSIIGATSEAAVHTMTLAEVLVGAVRLSRVPEMLARLADLNVRELDRRPDEAGELARLRSSTGLKLPDCCVLLAAQALDSPVATFDERLARAARAQGLEVLGAGL